jgi:putative nucleotidyltransferase with HDIG domain
MTTSDHSLKHTGVTIPEQLPQVKVPIRAKIILPYLLLAVFLALGAAYLVTQIVFDSLEERFTNQLIESGKLASAWMYREEERLLATLRLVANVEGLPAAIQSRQAERIRELTFGIVVDNREEAVEILDTQGYLLLSMRHISGGHVEDYEFAKEGDQTFINWELVSNVVHKRPDSYSDKYSGWIRADWGDYFYIAGPILDPSGSQIGTVLVGKSLATITRQMREETLAQVSLYDLTGKVIASTFSQPVALESETVSGLLQKQDTNSLRRTQRDLQVTNIDYQEIVGPWEVRENRDIGAVGIALPKTFYVSPSRVTRLQVLLLVSVTFFFVIVLGANLARVITKPLLSLVHASTQVSKGDLDVRVEPRSDDEVAVLTEAFNQMVASLQASRDALFDAYDRTLEGWSKALELRDKETEGHTLRVTNRTVELARWMGIREKEDLTQIQRGALLHDIGKMGIPDQILLKPGKLSEEEWKIMRRHPEFAYEMLWPIEYLRPALDIPYCHHEKWDGTGYPRRLKGDEIPIAARIFAVVDVWDALTSDRPYRRAMGREEALAEIKQQSGRHFDPQVVDAFLNYINNDDGG